MRRTICARGFRCAVDFDIDGIAARAQAARDRALPQIGAYIRDRSTAIAPRRSGAMAASARVESAAGKVTVRYGTVYAAIQHERADFHHPNGGQAKYLQSVMEDSATQTAVEQIFAAQMKSLL